VTSKLITLPQGGYDGFVSKENDDHNRTGLTRGVADVDRQR